MKFSHIYRGLKGASQAMLEVKNPPTNSGDVGDLGAIPGTGRSPGEANGTPLQYSCLENPMDGGAWRAIVHGVAKSWTWLKWLRTQNTTISLSSYKEVTYTMMRQWQESTFTEYGLCSFNPPRKGGCYHQSRFIMEETEVRRDWDTCLELHS